MLRVKVPRIFLNFDGKMGKVQDEAELVATYKKPITVPKSMIDMVVGSIEATTQKLISCSLIRPFSSQNSALASHNVSAT